MLNRLFDYTAKNTSTKNKNVNSRRKKSKRSQRRLRIKRQHLAGRFKKE